MSILDELREGLAAASAEATQAIAGRLAVALPPVAILALEGDLGLGKTTFVQGLARAWGIEETVKSPSYNLVSMYAGARQLVHVDAYRLESPEAFEGLMLEEFLRPPYCLAIEWPERIREVLPPETWWLRFSMGEAHARRLELL